MTGNSILQCLLFFGTVTLLGVPLGRYMARVYEGKAAIAGKVLGPIERVLYRLSGIDSKENMSWQRYAASLLVFNAIGFVIVYGLQRVQGHLPLNPAALGAVSPEVSFNTAISFATNTNWQAYGGESTMSYLTQMLALTVQNFLSAATGMAVLVALVRGFTQKSAAGLGSFWVDMVRSTIYVLLPLSFIVALVLVSQGVVQTFDAYVHVGETWIARGPAASQIAIKQLGTNGGGFFNVNSAHPFENPTPFANFVEVVAIILIPAALCFTFGDLIKQRRQGWALFAAMMLVLVPLTFATMAAEAAGNPALHGLGIDDSASATSTGGNMEGKEVRFGTANSAIWAATTTAASNGSVNSMHDSYTPLGGLVPLVLMQFGEIIFGGVGSGLYGLIIYAIIAVFIAGLMVGRTPEYLGKKIEAFEMKMASLVILLPAACVLVGTAIASAVPAGTTPVFNPGAHGFSEILYSFTSASNNNGSAFGGITVNGMFYAVAHGIAMLIGRYWVIVPVLAIAGSLSRKKEIPSTVGTLPTHTPLFVALLVGTILLVGALTFIPADALGPIVEQLTLAAEH
ncbi:MAG: potassium-transporting ATPase subunit KdpA [Sandaracinaceae bacterium]|nr:potassium-transporting ATPase subunit KdpA [Sandaracinaceae bacterium]